MDNSRLLSLSSSVSLVAATLLPLPALADLRAYGPPLPIERGISGSRSVGEDTAPSILDAGFYQGAIAAPRLLLAHAILVKAQPEQEATVPASPQKIELWFNEGVGREYAALAVIDANGARVDSKDAQLGVFDRSYLSVSVPPVLPGTYTVRYRVLSADGHVVSGKYNFSVQAP